MDCGHCGHPLGGAYKNKDGITLRGAILFCIGKQSPLIPKTSPLRTPPQPSPVWEEVVTTDLYPHQQDIILPPPVGGLGRGPLGVDGSVSVLPLRPLREITISMLTRRIGFMQQS